MRRSSVCLIALLFLAPGCGSSGSPAEFFPEARFLVSPLGGQSGTSFAVEYIASGDARHTFQPGRVFNATDAIGFFLDNAAPPYAASFLWLDGAEADISLIVSGRTIQISPIRLGPNNGDQPVELRSVASDGSMPATEPATPEVRFEILASPGTLFQSTVGDFFTSYDVGFTVDDDETLQALAPAVIFFENPRETVSGVARNASHLDITLNLYINGSLIQSATSNKDAIVKKDL